MKTRNLFLSTILFTTSVLGFPILITSCSGDSPAEEKKPDVPVIPDKPNEPNKPEEPPFNPTAPSIVLLQDTVNVFGGSKVEQADSLLLIGGDTIAAWSTGNTKLKALTLTFNNVDLPLGSTLSEKGLLRLTVTNEGEKSVSTDINITDDAIGNLSLLQRTFQVDEEVDLLDKLTFVRGVELTKTELEFEGQRTAIADAKHFIPEYPGPCSLIFTVRKNDYTAELKVDDLTIKPLDYTTPSIESADPIKDYFSRYNNLTPKTKEFIYHHLLTSYLCMDRYKQDNLEYILMGEVPESFECENIGNPNTRPGSHADQGYANLKHISPKSIIKVCGGDRQCLENYINQHPDKVFMVSCADDALSGDTAEKLRDDPNYDCLKRILGEENIIISVALGNRTPPWIKKIEENTAYQEGGLYNSSSVTSDKNNKITVVGYNPNQKNIFGDDSQSAIPIGFGKGNRIIPFIPLVGYVSNQELSDNTRSSYPTSAESGSLGNFLSIIMHTHPGTTLEDAMTIMIDNYLREETFKYKNDEGNIVDGDKWYFFDTAKFIDNEILHKSNIDAIQLNSDDVELPNHVGIIYEGVGIQFEYDGKRYDVTDTAHLTAALTSGSPLRWFWNKTRYRKYGGTSSVTITAQYVDTHGKTVPDVKLSITKDITIQVK